MIRIVFCFIVFSLLGSINNAYAHQIQSQDLPDHLGITAIPLTKAERDMLNMQKVYNLHGVEPFFTSNGKLVYVHGASLITILASPLQLVDIELQNGELVNEIMIGDGARWQVLKGSVGTIPHIFIKPVQANISTNLVITTNKRVYHLRLVSSETNITPYVGFVYSEEVLAYRASEQEKQAHIEKTTTTQVEGQKLPIDALNFNYKILGNEKWKPERIYDTGVRTYIEFPPQVKQGMPILLVNSGKRAELVNYRVKDNIMVIDGIYDEFSLLLGIADNEEKIVIVRNN